MSFGISIGDILTTLTLTHQAISALKSGPSDLRSLTLDCHSLTLTLRHLADEAQAPTSLYHKLPHSRQEHLRLLLENCRNGMESLRKLVYKYDALGGEEKKGWLERVRLAKESKQGLRERVALHVASLGMFLTGLSNGALGRVEFLLANRAVGAGGIGTGGEVHGGQGLRAQEGGAGVGVGAEPGVGTDVWGKIGRELAKEGVTGEQVARFEEDVKAYVRHLVRGETPFWKTEPEKGARLHGVASAKPAGVIVLEGRSKKDAINAEKKRLEGEKERLEREKAKMQFEMEMMQKTKMELEMPKMYKGEDERLEEKIKMELEMEAMKKSRDDASKGTTTIDIASELDGLFDLDELEPQVAEVRLPSPPSPPAYYQDSHQDIDQDTEPSPKNPSVYYQHGNPSPRDPSALYQEPYLTTPAEHPKSPSRPPSALNPPPASPSSAILRERKRLTRYLDEYDGKSGPITRSRKDYLANEAIPHCGRELGKLMPISRESPVKWRYKCDVCHLFIPGERHNCAICREGNWDVCRECWDQGKGCGEGGHVLRYFGV